MYKEDGICGDCRWFRRAGGDNGTCHLNPPIHTGGRYEFGSSWGYPLISHYQAVCSHYEKENDK